jgi:hypothetical protein
MDRFNKPLKQALKDVMSGVKATLEAEIGEGKLLEGITEIVKGERVRVKPTPPFLMIFREQAQALERTTIKVVWQIPITIVCVYQDEEPEIGQDKAEEYTAIARSILLKSRNLGYPDFIKDIKDLSFLSEGEEYQQGNIYTSAAQLTITFISNEF